jgi:hypothetical protein
MEHAGNIDPSQFIHVRMVLSMVVSLVIARLLRAWPSSRNTRGA